MKTNGSSMRQKSDVYLYREFVIKLHKKSLLLYNNYHLYVIIIFIFIKLLFYVAIGIAKSIQ